MERMRASRTPTKKLSEIKESSSHLSPDMKMSYIEYYIDRTERRDSIRRATPRKRKLLEDYRLKTLSRLSTIEMLSRQQFEDLTSRITSLKACYSLTERELERTPFCKDCNFKPSQEVSASRDPRLELDTLDEELDRLFDNWTETLLSNLKDPVVGENIKLLAPEGKQLIEKFMDFKELKEELVNEQAFIKALTEAFSTLEKIELTTQELQERLFGDHAPKTPQEMRKRFESLIDEKTRGKDINKVRIILKEGDK
jgi:hypothetical protein